MRFARTAVLACAHGASVRRTPVLACAQCASRTEEPSNGLRKYHRRERHDGTTHSHVDFLNLIIDYARATVVRAHFLAAAFSDGSYLAHVNGAYLRHVKFCIVRGPPLFIVSPISQRWPLPRLVQSPRRRTPASPLLVQCADPHSDGSHRSGCSRIQPASPNLV